MRWAGLLQPQASFPKLTFSAMALLPPVAHVLIVLSKEARVGCTVGTSNGMLVGGKPKRTQAPESCPGILHP